MVGQAWMAQGNLGMHDVEIFAIVSVEETNPSRQGPVLEGLSEGTYPIC